MHKEQRKKTVTAGMHYATMAALIISNITVFILCILFSGVLGTGLINIAIIGHRQQAASALESHVSISGAGSDTMDGETSAFDVR